MSTPLDCRRPKAVLLFRGLGVVLAIFVVIAAQAVGVPDDDPSCFFVSDVAVTADDPPEDAAGAPVGQAAPIGAVELGGTSAGPRAAAPTPGGPLDGMSEIGPIGSGALMPLRE